MTQQLRFDNHTAFHRQVLRVTLAGAALGLAGYLLTFIADFSGGLSAVAQLAITATVLGLAATPPQRRHWIAVVPLALGVALIAALAMRALASSPPAYPWFGVCVYGLAVGLIAGRDLKDRRRYALPLATGLSMLLATWVRAVFVGQLPLADYVPAFLAEPIYGAVFGFLVGTGLVVRQLRLEKDKVLQAFDQIKGSLTGEMLELCERGMSTYQRVSDVLRDREGRGVTTDPKLVQGVQSLMLKIISLGRRWQEVEREAGRTSASALADRVAELDEKIAAAGDRVARRQYEMARDALQAQLRYLRDISRNRERVTARVHNYLAALERLNLAVLNHQGADAAKFSDELQPILDEIEDMGVEMDIASEAISEAAEAVLRDEDRDEDRDEGEEPAEERPAAAELEAAAKAAVDAAAEPEPEADADTEGEAEADPDPEAEADPEAELQRRVFE